MTHSLIVAFTAVLTFAGTAPHPFAIFQDARCAGDHEHTCDANGNLVRVEARSIRRTILWDAEDRVSSISNHRRTTEFIYDDAGQRVLKIGAQAPGSSEAWVRSRRMRRSALGARTRRCRASLRTSNDAMGVADKRAPHEADDPGAISETLYANPFWTVRNGSVGTKHIFVGETRIASKLSPGRAHLDPPPGDDLAGILGRWWEHRSERGHERARNTEMNPHYRVGSTMPAGMPETNFVYFYHPDHLGSTQYVTDVDGELYEHVQYFPSGEPWIRQDTNTERLPYLFTSQELDQETGLYYFGARYYNPRDGVWISPDPAHPQHLLGEGYGGGVLYPPQLNLFGYSANNPVRLLDPNGRDFGDFIAGFGETVEGSLQGIGGDILMQMSPVTALFWRSSEIAAAFAVDAFRGVIEVALTIIPGAHQFRGVVESLLQLDQYAALVQTAINDPDEEARDRARGQIAATVSIAIAEILAVRRAAARAPRAPRVDGRTGRTGGARPVRIGQAGEAAVRRVHDIGPKRPIDINGRRRIPDGITPQVLTEVKNVRRLSFTRQLRDFADFAEQTGRRFDLFVRRDTLLSGPLSDAIESGLINRRYIP